MFGGEKLTVSQLNNNNNIGEKQCQPLNPKNLKKKQKKFSTGFSTDWNASIELSTELSTGELVFHRQPEVIHSWTEFSTGYPQVFNNLSTYSPTALRVSRNATEFSTISQFSPWSYPQWLWITYQKTMLFKKAKKKRAKFSTGYSPPQLKRFKKWNASKSFPLKFSTGG